MAERETFMGENPSHFDGCGPDCPVENVSWDDAQRFVERLNFLSSAYGDGAEYRLPTEAEWEYAARAGTSQDRYSDDLEAIAWYDENSGARTHPVGQKAPNVWGLHDMLGNVLRWCRTGWATIREEPSRTLRELCRDRGGWCAAVAGTSLRTAREHRFESSRLQTPAVRTSDSAC